MKGVRVLGRALLCLTAAAVLYVLSAAVFLPHILAYRWVNPGATALMRLRAEQGIPVPPADDLPWVRLGAVAPSLLNAILHAEDDRFPVHHGFDVARVRLAARRNLARGEIRAGASTITQQLAKNLFLSPTRTPLRKLKEAALAVGLEAALPKPRILELYVNVIEWGPGTYGVAAAARRYFEKPPRRLTASESALLAASIPSPLRRNPARPTRWLRRRQLTLLRQMARSNLVPVEWRR